DRALRERHYPRVTLLPEEDVADREHLVDHQHVAVEEGEHRETEPRAHSRRIELHGLVDVLPDLGELEDVVEPRAQIRWLLAEKLPAVEDVLRAREMRVEARAELEQREHLAHGLVPSRRGVQDPGQDLQERALASAVSADEAEPLAAL